METKPMSKEQMERMYEAIDAQKKQIIRKHALSMLADKLDEFFENFFEIFIWINDEGLILYTNQKTCDATGYTFYEIVGSHFLDFVDERSKAATKEHWLQSQEEKNLTHQSLVNYWTCKDGRSIKIVWNLLWFKNHEWTSACQGTILES